MGSFDAKKPPSKISCLGTFKKYFKKVNLKKLKQKIDFSEKLFSGLSFSGGFFLLFSSDMKSV
jgi:hypothetical protein